MEQMWAQDKCTEYVNLAFSKVRADKSSSFSVFRERSFLLVSWLLRKYYAENELGYEDYPSRILELINLQTKRELKLLLETQNSGGIMDQICFPNTMIITDQMLTAIDIALTDDPAFFYRTNNIISFFDDSKITGYDFLTYICSLKTPKTSLIDSIGNAFSKALGIRQPSMAGNLKLIQGNGWSFLLSVVTDTASLAGNTLIETHSTHLKASSDNTIVLCFCPPIIEEAEPILNAAPYVYYMWGGSCLTFFNRLKETIKNYGKEAVAENFIKIFDPSYIRKGAYSSFIAIERLESELARLHPQKKK